MRHRILRVISATKLIILGFQTKLRYKKFGNNSILCLVAVALLAPAGTAWGQEAPVDWLSIRHTGMGSATTAHAVDSESVFANPAGLARIRNPRSRAGLHEVHFPRFGIASGEAHLDTIGDKLFSDPQTLLPRILEKAPASGNSATHFEASFFPSIVFGGKTAATWLIGTYARNRTDFIHQDGHQALVFDIRRDTTVGAVIGVAGSARAGTFAYGLSVRPNARYYSSLQDVDISAEGPPELLSDTMTLGRTVGFGLDGGVLFTAADFWLPTIGLAVRNMPVGCANQVTSLYTDESLRICGTKRTGKNQEGENRTLVDPMDLRVGVSMTPRFRLGPERLNLRLAADASPIGIRQDTESYGMPDVPLTKMLKFGGELFFGHPLRTAGFAARAGVESGESTWGATLQFWFLQLDYSSFAREAQFDDGSTSFERLHYLGFSTVW